ncbi:uncharacterized protein LAESUDRAFT_809679 [Laetiporus sulphureus 93-53]|uniref:DUF6697 domain-containing protein n=1 Tax=Laetiporus sulphureus 93-53 TaxID=1314785 RepID=A0A165GT41_9APHY|nr:uncharacterized protein LAESUDRAFT_809679 [Laetiporus sulphureus 93-53]KZT10774.1 hypothetical protein LAESUDRAFT_809679 [Laetiporus sulphureus 93-53]
MLKQSAFQTEYRAGGADDDDDDDNNSSVDVCLRLLCEDDPGDSTEISTELTQHVSHKAPPQEFVIGSSSPNHSQSSADNVPRGRSSPNVSDRVIKRSASPITFHDWPPAPELLGQISKDEADETDTGPRRKRACMKPEVVPSPTRSSYSTRRRQADICDPQEATAMSGFLLQEDTVHRRLRGCHAFAPTLDAGTSLTTVNRACIPRIHSGSPQRLRAKKVHPRGSHDVPEDVLFFDPQVYTHAPQRPGEPGLFYTVIAANKRRTNANTNERSRSARIFVRLAAQAWLYAGDYTMTQTELLSRHEWQRAGAEMQQRLAETILRRPCYRYLRAWLSLYLRMGREASDRETEDEMLKAARRRSDILTAEDILAALDSRQLLVVIWKMQCVGYDKDFQRRTMSMAAESHALSTRVSFDNTEPSTQGITTTVGSDVEDAESMTAFASEESDAEDDARIRAHLGLL